MRKTTSLKISLFAFISSLICLFGNMLLGLDIVTVISMALGFLGYLFFTICISQLIYERARFAVNLIIMFMSFAMGLYSIYLVAFSPFDSLIDYYIFFFYSFVIVFLICSIVLVGRIIFYNPPKNAEETAVEREQAPVSATAKKSTKAKANTWTCSCGVKNTGKFCSECGAPIAGVKPTEADTETAHASTDSEQKNFTPKE